MKGVKTYVGFGDVHAENEYLDMLFPFLSDFKPDHLIVAGDFADFKIISDFDKHERRFKGKKDTAKEVMDEIGWCNTKLDYIDRLLPKSKKQFLLGNHENRFDKFCKYEEVQFNEGHRTIKNQFRLDGRRWGYTDLRGSYKIGKCYFMHGDALNSHDYSKNAAMRFRKNVRLWHHHTNQSYMISSPLDSNDCCEVKGIGCLCDKYPAYMKGLTNRWIHSFLVGYVYPNGNFQDFIVNIIDGKFIAPNGKIYS